MALKRKKSVTEVPKIRFLQSGVATAEADTLTTTHHASGAGDAVLGFPAVFPRLSDDYESQPHVRSARLLTSASGTTQRYPSYYP